MLADTVRALIAAAAAAGVTELTVAVERQSTVVVGVRRHDGGLVGMELRDYDLLTMNAKFPKEKR